MDLVAQPALTTPSRCLGIDFSGDFRMWSPGCGKSNVWIAETESGVSGLRLVNLQRAQELGGDCNPFTRLVQYLRQSSFDVAAIDAPFSIPEDHLPANGHRELLELVASMELSGTRPFPSAQALVDSVLKGMSPIVKKPLRRTEHHWKQKGVNVRSTLWSGPRGGAAMTAACLKLLHQAHCPIWPWERNGPGLLVEAFPAAQLYQWGLPHQAYNRSTEKESAIRRSLVLSLTTRIELGAFCGIMEESADAFDAVVCAFAANAVAGGHSLWYAEEWLSVEGLIAVAGREAAAEFPSG